MNDQSTTFTYTYSPKRLAALATASVIWTAIFCYRAVGNDRGLIIQRAIRLDPSGATTFYWSAATLGVLALLFFLSVFFTRDKYPRKIVLESKYFIAPTSRWPFSMYEEVVRYDAVERFQTITIYPYTMLRIFHKGGKVEVDGIRFESKAHFRAFCQELAMRVTISQTGKR